MQKVWHQGKDKTCKITLHQMHIVQCLYFAGLNFHKFRKFGVVCEIISMTILTLQSWHIKRHAFTNYFNETLRTNYLQNFKLVKYKCLYGMQQMQGESSWFFLPSFCSRVVFLCVFISTSYRPIPTRNQVLHFCRNFFTAVCDSISIWQLLVLDHNN